jgi:periplasmic divalent cation tolerance protein
MSLIVLCTLDDADKAKTIARTLVEEKLAACVSLLPGATSIYFWEGKLQESAEILLVIKTRSPLWKRLRSRLKALHPYKTPEIVGIKMQKTDRKYADWLKTNTRLIRVAGGARNS